MTERRQRDLVTRRRVLDRLDDRLRCRLTLLEAGAGFGKSTAMRQAIAESDATESAREIVVTCLPDEHPASGAESIIASLASRLGVNATAGAIADAVLASSPKHVVLWVDDVHHMTDNTDALVDLLAALPGNGHLVLVGRHIPLFPTARLQVDGQLSFLGEDDLRFDADERAAFLHLRGANTEAASEAASSGWPALMELELAAGRSGAADYLTEEVLIDTPPAQLDALRRLVDVDAIDIDMVRNVTDFDGSLADLVDGIPLVHVDQIGEGDTRADIVSLHDLMRDALRAHTTSDDAAAATIAVAHELLRRNDHVGAARRFAAVRNRQGIERVAERLLDDLHFATTVGDRLAAVDVIREMLGQSPTAITLHAVTSAIIDPVNSRDALTAALAAAEQAGRHDLKALCLVRLAERAYLGGDPASVSQFRTRVAALQDAGEPVAERLGFLIDVWLHRLCGQDREIVRMVDDLIERDAFTDDEMRSVAIFYRTVSLAYSGRAREALLEVERHVNTLPPGLFTDRLGGFVTIQRWMLGEQTDQIVQRAMNLIDRIEARGQIDLFVEGAGSTAIFCATRGDLTTAHDLVRRAEARRDTLDERAWGLHTIAQACAVVDVLSGDERSAAERLERSIPAGGPNDGLPSHIYNLTAALSYVLVPRTREYWDAASVAPDLEVRTEVGRALVAFRERGDVGPAAALPWHEVHRIRPWALEPHLVELGVAAIAGGERAALAALTDLRHDPVESLDRLAASTDPALEKAARQAIRVTPRRPSAAVMIGVLGPLTVERNGADEADTPVWRRARVRDLLCLLVHERKVSRTRAAEILWPDKPAKAGQNNLRVNLSHLLDAFDATRPGSAPSWFVRVENDLLRLDESEFLRVDVDRFTDLVGSARSIDADAPRQALDLYLSACALYRGDYLVDSSIHEAVYFESLRLRGDFVESAVRTADLLLAIGEPAEAERIAMRASMVEPLNESSQRVLAGALLAQRRVGAATDVLHHLLRQLRDVKIPPEPETVRLATRLGIELMLA